MILEDGIVMDSQHGDKRSDGARLTYNLLHWLSEPSLAAGGFGNYKAPPPAPPPPPDLGFLPDGLEQDPRLRAVLSPTPISG